jgi:hypothetical protein
VGKEVSLIVLTFRDGRRTRDESGVFGKREIPQKLAEFFPFRFNDLFMYERALLGVCALKGTGSFVYLASALGWLLKILEMAVSRVTTVIILYSSIMVLAVTVPCFPVRSCSVI